MSSTAIRGPLDTASRLIAAGTIAVWIAVKSLAGGEASALPSDPQGWFKWASEAVGYAAFAVVGFRFLFEKYLWRRRLFRGWLVRFPDMTGTWHARLESTSFGTTFRSVVTLDHRFDRLIYRDFRAIKEDGEVKIVSTSHVRTWSLERIEQDDSVHLFVIYDNEPGQQSAKQEHTAKHRGCLALRLHNENQDRKDWVLKGDYWTTKEWRSPSASVLSPALVGGTLGTVEMNWIKATLASTIDADAQAYLKDCPELSHR